MSRTRTQSIHEFILDRVAIEPRSIARQVAQAYGISRQAANRHLDAMVESGLLEQAGQTRAREYHLRRTSSLSRELRVTPVLNPDRVWDDHVAPILTGDRPGVRDLCRGAFGELVRNAAAHARASWITFTFMATARHIDLAVSDDGRGIFAVLAQRTGAATARDAAEEVARGARARSSDAPASSLVLLARNFEHFTIASSGVVIEFNAENNRWQVHEDGEARAGTAVNLRARRNPEPSAARIGREFMPSRS
jgi:hypothetical protein